MTTKICSSCLVEKEQSEFELRADTKKYRNQCKMCRSEYCANWYQESGSVIKLKNNQYKIENKAKLREDNRVYYNKRYAEDPEYKIHKIISVIVRNGLKSNNSSKDGESILEFLSYTMKELRAHLESQFESWMTWDNHGCYNPSIWNDNDQATWAWQIDHIIPRSDLQYSSMEDDNFKKCWSLDNLRPLSAKQNLSDGIKRIRHRKR